VHSIDDTIAVVMEIGQQNGSNVVHDKPIFIAHRNTKNHWISTFRYFIALHSKGGCCSVRFGNILRSMFEI
jgi:hypothetical protein